MQEVIYRVKPDVIVETGIAHGGSLIFSASLCRAMGRGRVIGVDIDIRAHNREAIEAHEMFELIELIEGSSTAPEIVDQVRAQIGPHETVLVILDTNHPREHVRDELEAYAALVTPGSYIVATDGVMEWLTDVPRGEATWDTDNPKVAVEQWLPAHPEFVLEDPPPFVFSETPITERITHWPGAYLRRTDQVMSSMRCERDAGPLGGRRRRRRSGSRPSPSTRFSSTHARCGRVDAEHRRARADRAGRARRRSCRGARAPGAAPCGSRCRRRSTEPGRRGLDPLDGCARSSRPGRRPRTTSCAHSGCTITLAAGVLGPERRDVLGPEALVHRAVALPEQERGVLDVALLEAAAARGAGSRPACRPRRSPCRSRCCGRGAGRGRRAPCRPWPSAHSSTARAFDDVHTAPPCPPTNAFSAADEFM